MMMPIPLQIILLLLQATCTTASYLRADDLSAIHRQLAQDSLCNVHYKSPGAVYMQTFLDAQLDTLHTMPECANIWADFETKIGTDQFLKASTEEEAKTLDEFCKTPCGAAFDKAVGEWRSFCESPQATFEALADTDGTGFRMDGFIAEYGCMKSATGQYCARLIMDDLRAADDDLAAKCPYYSSCCFGNMHKLLRVPDLDMEVIESKCAGAKAAFEAKCAATTA